MRNKKPGRPVMNNQVTIFIFRRRGLMAAGAVMFASVWVGLTGPAVLAGLILAVGVVARTWSGLSLKRVLFDRSLSAVRAFPGDSIELKMEVENRKPLPLARLEIDQVMPRNLGVRGVEIQRKAGENGHLRLATPLLWYRRASWPLVLECRRRGLYPLPPAGIASSDIFGLVPSTGAMGRQDEIIVYPKVHPLSRSVLPTVHPLGETKAETRIFEDPTQTIGLRRYTPEVPFKHIHWKASARHRSLQAKVFEPTTSLKTALFLEAEWFEGLKAPCGEVHFELALSLLASLARHLIDQGHPVGFLSNSVSSGGADQVRLWPAGGLDRLTLILEYMARLQPRSGPPFPQFFESVQASLPWGATLVVVTARLTPPLQAHLEFLGAAGFTVATFQVGNNPLPEGRLKVKRILKPADFARNDS